MIPFTQLRHITVVDHSSLEFLNRLDPGILAKLIDRSYACADH
jgi:hypothetical protein